MWTLMDKLGYVLVYTWPHSYFRICTRLGVHTQADGVLNKPASL